MMKLTKGEHVSLHHAVYPADGSLKPTDMNPTLNAVKLPQLLSINVRCCDSSSLLCERLQLEKLESVPSGLQNVCTYSKTCSPAFPLQKGNVLL